MRFPKDWTIIAHVKRIPGARWSYTLQAWHLPPTEEARKAAQQALGELLSYRPL
ncbi:hypothetical protein [Catalinimonas alkaloidigena]|uniref:hypothetical protein n=1 Tax=Catalinimonas alkaloidigena TaxID=1075417 RepID=UPI0015A25336|nr:hypothetical protein [Catalinimonas alkaloidigena]